MKTYRFPLFFLSFLPLLFRIPYLFKTWRESPLDRYDAIFWVAAFVLSLLSLKKFRIWTVSTFQFHTAAIPIFFALAIMAAGWLGSISTIFLAGSILFIAGTVCFLFGERMFSGTLPIWGLLLLGCPSTAYWSGYWMQSLTGELSISGLIVKLTFASVLIIWMLIYTHPPLLKNLIFPAFVLLALLILVYQQRRPLYGEPLFPDMKQNRFGSWLGGTEVLTEQESVFFKGTTAIKKNFFDDTSVISLLALELGGNVHSVHPTELCLKSGGSIVLGNHELILPTGRGDLAVQEILLQGKDRQYLIYTCYVNEKWSTGNFLAFRRSWKKETNWKSFQMMTPAEPDIESARKRFLLFLNAILTRNSETGKENNRNKSLL